MARIKKSNSPTYMFKVVAATKNGLKSARASFVDNGKHSINYRTQRWVKPHKLLPNSKIFVFDSFKNAKEFANGIGAANNEYIYLCEVKNAQQMLKMADFSNQLDIFWQGKMLPKLEGKCPVGTYGCDAVKLLKRIC
jgi:hypothetical protein